MWYSSLYAISPKLEKVKIWVVEVYMDWTTQATLINIYFSCWNRATLIGLRMFLYLLGLDSKDALVKCILFTSSSSLLLESLLLRCLALLSPSDFVVLAVRFLVLVSFCFSPSHSDAISGSGRPVSFSNRDRTTWFVLASTLLTW